MSKEFKNASDKAKADVSDLRKTIIMASSSKAGKIN